MKLSRRIFVRRSALAASTLIIPASAIGLAGEVRPSSRIRMGFIGQGTQGSGHLHGGAWTHLNGGYLARPEVQVMAVCDIRKGRREASQNRVNQAYAARIQRGDAFTCEAYVDFRELLARYDIDAVLIACPVHWHAMIAMMAMEAGKDVYCEKPIAPTIAQGRAMVESARRHARIYQAGTQQRSEYSSKFRLACELVRSGRIGTLKEVWGYRTGGAYTWPGKRGAPQPVPPDLDWDLFLGPAQWLPYDGDPGTFRFQYGDINWTPHHFDFIHWVLDADRTGPTEISMVEGAPAFRYASGVVVYGRPHPNEPVGGVGGACFVGTSGRIAVDREKIVAEPASILKQTPGPQETSLYRSSSHAGNFLECIRTRQPTICEPETAHRAQTLVLLGGIIMQVGGVLKWDPAAERFTNSDEANRLLHVAPRQPWRI